MEDKDELKGSVPRDAFHPAVTKYSISQSPISSPWKSRDIGTMCIYEIVKEGDYDLHLSVNYSGIFKHVKKFHFTLRKGPGKGTETQAWFNIEGFDGAATLLPRDNRGQVSLLTDPKLPPAVKKQVDMIDKYANDIFRKTLSFIKPKGQQAK